MKYAQPYRMTPRRRAALRKAQIAAATRRRYGYTKHDVSRFVAKGVRLVARKTTLGATSKAAAFSDFVKMAQKNR